MAVEKSQFAVAMVAVQAALRRDMKQAGFRIRGRTYNRPTTDGLTQVVQFQMGRFDPPGTYHIPGMRENLYGRFTVNVGVYAPEVALHCYPGKVGAFVPEGACFIRERLGNLGPERVDLWWDLRQPEIVAAHVWERLDRDAFPFLARFESREAILREWLGSEQGGNMGPPPWIVCAVILAARGQRSESRTLLQTQLREPGQNPRHHEWVQNLAVKLGLGKLDV